jgi:branched-chain amino acid transport system substrate-binding protein
MLLVAIMLAGLPLASTKTLAATPAAAATKTIKVGVICWTGFGLGADFWKGVQLAAQIANNKGGLAVGNDKYHVELILGDSKLNSATGKTAAEKLVYQDKVNFILGDETSQAWLPVTEQNKVIMIAGGPLPYLHSADNNYTFQGTEITSQTPVTFSWLTKHDPSVKAVVISGPDDQIGHAIAGSFSESAKKFNLKVADIVYYPRETADFSPTAAKIKATTADAYVSVGAGPESIALLFKALHEINYTAKKWNPQGGPEAGLLMSVVGPAPIEGLIGGLNAISSDSPPPVSKEFKDAYIAKYGKWDYPETLFANTWYMLQAGIQKAQSIDPDKIAAALHTGLSFENLEGPAMVVPRPDLGNPKKATDLAVGLGIMQVKNGKIVQIDSISTKEAFAVLKQFFNWP